jgi:hypothetical protein
MKFVFSEPHLVQAPQEVVVLGTVLVSPEIPPFKRDPSLDPCVSAEGSHSFVLLRVHRASTP